MKKLTTLDLKNFHGYQPRKERVKQGSFEAYVDSDGLLVATSYQWWKIVDNKNGLYFFNWYCYSMTTRKHQHEASRMMENLGLEYITVSYSPNLGTISLEKILEDKVNSLYTGENEQSMKRQGAYAVYTEESFNETLSDIRKIAAALKMSDAQLDSMLMNAEDKANEALLIQLADKHERQTTRRAMQKANENLAPIEL